MTDQGWTLTLEENSVKKLCLKQNILIKEHIGVNDWCPVAYFCALEQWHSPPEVTETTVSPDLLQPL